MAFLKKKKKGLPLWLDLSWPEDVEHQNTSVNTPSPNHCCWCSDRVVQWLSLLPRSSKVAGFIPLLEPEWSSHVLMALPTVWHAHQIIRRCESECDGCYPGCDPALQVVTTKQDKLQYPSHPACSDRKSMHWFSCTIYTATTAPDITNIWPFGYLMPFIFNTYSTSTVNPFRNMESYKM